MSDVRRNIKLTFALIRQAAADEAFARALAAASADGPMVLIPADDPDLARSNEAMAGRLARRNERFAVLEVARTVERRVSRR